MNIKVLGGKAAAEFNYMAGEGLNSNPYPKGSEDYDKFMVRMGELQHEEFKRECEEMHCAR